MKLNQKLNRMIMPMLFFGLLLLPILWFDRPSFLPVPELQENRKMEPFPKASILWLQKMERWFNDRFGMRDALIYYGSILQMSAGTGGRSDVIIGRDGWLFFDEGYVPGRLKFAELLGRQPLPEQDLQAISSQLHQAQHALQQCGIPFYFVLAPNKQSIYPEKLRVRPTQTHAESNADQLMKHLAQVYPDLPVLDLRAPLKAAKAAQPYELYLRTDTHWNTLGAFVGYQTIADRLVADRIMAPSERTQLDAYQLQWKGFEGGDIAVNILSLPGYYHDEKVHFTPNTPRQAQSSELIGWPALSLRYDNPNASGNLMLYRDSFSEELLPFLAEDFNQLYAIWTYKIDGNDIRQVKPDVVILEIVERHISLLKAPEALQNMQNACSR